MEDTDQGMQLRLFSHLLSLSTDAIQVADEAGRLVFLNQTACFRLGIEPSDVTSYQVRDFEKVFQAEGVWAEHVQLLKQKGEMVVEGENIHQKTGVSFPVEVTVRWVCIGQKAYVIASSRDITERLKTSQIIDRQLRLQDLLLRLSDTYIHLHPDGLNEAVDHSLKELGEFVGADRSYIFTYDYDRQTASNTHEWCAEGVEPQLEYLQDSPMAEFPEWLEMHSKGEAFMIKRLEDLDPVINRGLIGILEPQGIKSIIALPIMQDGKAIGFVGFDWVKDYYPFNEEEKKLLFVYTRLLASVLKRLVYELKISRQEEKFRKVLNNMNLGLTEYDTSGKVIFANKRFLEMIESEVGDIDSPSIHESQLGVQYKSYIKKALQSSAASHNAELRVRTPNHTPWWFVSSTPRLNHLGEREGTIVVHLDISEQKRLHQSLEHALLTAEEAVKAKQVFLSSMSHEIRTPLTTIIGLIRMMDKEVLTHNQKFYLHKANYSAEHLLAILNNTMDINKISEGALELHPEPFDPGYLCKNVFDTFALIARHKELDFRLNLDPTLSKTLVGDVTRIRQILYNLLSNSIKFTERGFVSLSVKVLKTKKGHQIIRLEVEDTGVGMTDSFLKKIFDKYAQERGNASSNVRGAGLGMYISRDLARMMQSEIKIQSHLGQGTRAYLDLQLPVLKAPVEVKEELNPLLLGGIRILLVEDDPINRFIVSNTLVSAGASIVEVEDGLKALEVLNNDTFDAILLDVKLPGIDGLETCRRIRGQLHLDTPVLAFTANVFKQDIDSYFEAGMNDYIKKPYDEIVLVRKVAHICGIDKYEVETGHVSDNSDGLQQRFETTELKKISGGDQGFMMQLLKTLSEQMFFISQSNEEALREMNYGGIFKNLQQLRPHLEMMAAVPLVELVQEMDVNNPDLKNANAFRQKVSLINCHLKSLSHQLELMVRAEAAKAGQVDPVDNLPEAQS